MPTATAKHKAPLPLLPIGQPFIPRPKPRVSMPAGAPATDASLPGAPGGSGVSVPEPATLVGDRTGKAYAKVGEKGPETFIVPGPGGGPEPAVGKPVPMASGGFGVAGGTTGSGYDPYQTALDELRKRQAADSAITAAQNNVEDLAAVGTGQTLTNSENYKYGAAGVAAPTGINLPIGSTGAGLPPTVRANFRTEADQLTQQEGQRQSAAGYANQIAQLQSQGPSATVGGGGGAAPRVGGGGGGGGPIGGVAALIKNANSSATDSTQNYGGGSPYIDPFTNMPVTNLTPAARAVRENADNLKLQDEINPGSLAEHNLQQQARPTDLAIQQQSLQDKQAELQGLHPYENPDGTRSYLTPGDLAAQKALDKGPKPLTPAEIAAQNSGPYGHLTPASLISSAGQGALPIPDLKVALAQRVDEHGNHIYGPEEIAVMAKSAQLTLAKQKDIVPVVNYTLADPAAMKKFGKKYDDLTKGQQYEIDQDVKGYGSGDTSGDYTPVSNEDYAKVGPGSVTVKP